MKSFLSGAFATAAGVGAFYAAQNAVSYNISSIEQQTALSVGLLVFAGAASYMAGRWSVATTPKLEDNCKAALQSGLENKTEQKHGPK